MTDWKPGQKLQGPNGERAIWLGQSYSKSGNAVAYTDEMMWTDVFTVTAERFHPVDEWSDPVAEARERVLAIIGGGSLAERSSILGERLALDVLESLLHYSPADLCVLLDAEEAK